MSDILETPTEVEMRKISDKLNGDGDDFIRKELLQGILINSVYQEDAEVFPSFVIVMCEYISTSDIGKFKVLAEVYWAECAEERGLAASRFEMGR